VGKNNKLSINYSKIKSMLVSLKEKKSEFEVKIGKNKIELLKKLNIWELYLMKN